MALNKTGIDKFDYYTSEVLHGRISVCKWVRMAVERHYHDLERQKTKEFPYYFEPKACMHYVDFFENHLKHFDGIFDGDPIIFEPWQYFVYGSPFAWISTERIRNRAIRRFIESEVLISKKQGKSTIKAGESLYMMLRDNYPSAQCYILAINATHAKILAYRDAVSLVRNNPEMNDMLRINKGAADLGIYNDHDNSFFKPITSDSKKADGPKIHYVLLEEIKDWFDFELYDTLKNGMAADPTAMISSITTAGSDMTSLGYDRQQHAQKILTREIIDERTFAVIFTIEKEDIQNWDDMEIVKKANPNFGVSVQQSYYEKRIEEAKLSERKKNDFLIKHLGIWINSMDHYFTMESWMNIGRENADLSIDKFEGKPCYIFVDLASKKDICPVQYLFPYGKNRMGKRRYATFGRYFLPRDVVTEDLIGHRADYNAWAGMGLFELTPGNTVDYEEIKNHIFTACKKFKVIRVGFDDWGEDQIAQDLEKKRIRTVVIPQRPKYLSNPMKTVEAHIIQNDDDGSHDPRIIHNGDPVLAWTMGNVVAKEDANENVFPRKEHKNKKIDPAVALINLFCMEMEEPLPNSSARRAPIIMKV